ncbi:MAG: hypothetical protein R3C26_14605 [Calditrichia bacterium]
MPGAIATLSKDAKNARFVTPPVVQSKTSGLINSNKSSFAIAYSGHVWAARNGKLTNDETGNMKMFM